MCVVLQQHITSKYLWAAAAHLPYGLHASILPLSNIEKSHTIHFTIPHSIASIENRNGTIMYSTKPLGEEDKKRASHSHLITYAVFILLFSHDIWFVFFFCLFYIYKDIYAKAFERKITFCTYDITRMQPSCVTHTLNLRTLHMFVCAASVYAGLICASGSGLFNSITKQIEEVKKKKYSPNTKQNINILAQ